MVTRQDVIGFIKWHYRSLFRQLNPKSNEHPALRIPVNSYLPSLEWNFISNTSSCLTRKMSTRKSASQCLKSGCLTVAGYLERDRYLCLPKIIHIS